MGKQLVSGSTRVGNVVVPAVLPHLAPSGLSQGMLQGTQHALFLPDLREGATCTVQIL